ncbi:hypothetical protein SAMN05421748_103295 [Paractinoplanes atraurantiacus]|uniref:Uncharacterized protein n=1 Tax=Paractinoplanes atraurantiacus TaxID=1036182 RepID=A0A285H210_9ACTN|nr:hypothetical protein SAMN05421748_103295 [Actinoplanes atraurantiacus]
MDGQAQTESPHGPDWGVEVQLGMAAEPEPHTLRAAEVDASRAGPCGLVLRG